ncbi:adenosylmethionine decarboxylase [Vampirovibrio sp.]|uniref:adenosylmethionine decarboxylase n=1 Tax=Vampirovibrio sp. TaxID=2717857 RepID=UPI00359358D8
MNNVLGRHLLVEFYDCDTQTLDDVAGIETHMNDAARACGATIVQSTFHRFEPWGVSGVVVISESHLAIHTWPEYGYASVDLYTCGDEIDPMGAYEHLRRVLGAQESEIQMLKRGNLDLIKARLEQNALSAAEAELSKSILLKGGVL